MKRLQALVLLIFVLFVSCSKDDNGPSLSSTNDRINYFIWRGMYNYYLWENEISDLQASNLDNFIQANKNNSPENVFESLLFRPADRYSWIVNDYVALENSFQGVNVSNGMEFGLVRYKDNPNIVYGYIRYIVPNSDAFSKGLERGMIFNKVDGQQLTLNNYGGLLFGNNLNYSIEIANYNDGNPQENGIIINLSKSQLSENPIKVAKVFEENTTKIGYLMYNQFARNYDSELNAVFGSYKSQNIDELIIDLRYNSGGFTSSASHLASMITGQFSSQLFSKERWNDKVTTALDAEIFENYFTDKIVQSGSSIEENINSLNLTKVYFIVSGTTASASELLINSLSSYIDVRVIGSRTTGKNVGSITLYDSDNLQRSGGNLNQEHRYAIQPIVLEVVNREGNNFPNGIIPSINIIGIQTSENFGNLGVLGEREEPLLSRTIFYVLTDQKTGSSKNKHENVSFEEIYNSKLATPTSDNMYVDLKDIDFLKID